MTALNINEFKDSDFPSIGHEIIIRQNKNCGCLNCLSVYPVSEITTWMKETYFEERTAWCPKCGIDNVIPEIDGISFDKETLKLLIDIFNKEADLLFEEMMAKK
jgi:hypothetical protein